jgi:hypothetical protein
MELITRQDAAQASIDKFFGRSFEWGKRDCANLANHTLMNLGHRDYLANAKSYKTPLAARRAMKKAGVSDLGLFLDSIPLARIPAASMLPADIIGLPGSWHGGEDADCLALGICIGPSRFLAFGPQGCSFGDVAALPPDTPLIAWRSTLLWGAA